MLIIYKTQNSIYLIQQDNGIFIYYNNYNNLVRAST